MSLMAIYPEDGSAPLAVLKDRKSVAERLSPLGVRFEHWRADRPLGPNAGEAAVLAAYRREIEALDREYGLQSMDVVSLRPDHPQRAEFRSKFLREHTHADFEVRFFVEGRGLFYLHVDNRVYLVLCEAGDLISVPAQTTHWFDMGAAPDFRCIRLFTRADGWAGDFTGSSIAQRFPDFDRFCREIA